MQDVSAQMIEDLYAEEVPQAVVLITLSADGQTPIRVTNDPDGFESRGETYEHFPFGFSWGGAGQGEPTRGAKLTISNTDARIAKTVRLVPAGGQIEATIEVVRADAPDDVELAMTSARVSDIEIDDPEVTGTISPRDFDTEPACAPRYIAARTPGLF